MKNIKYSSAIVLICLMIAFMTGCPNTPDPPVETEGSLYISIDLQDRTSNLAAIEIEGKKGSSSFTETIELDRAASRASAYNTRVQDLAIGLWTLTASGLDADGHEFMAEQSPVQVEVIGGEQTDGRLSLALLKAPVSIDADTSTLSGIGRLEIRGYADNGSFYEPNINPSALPVTEDLVYGTWTISVEAYDADSDLIASGSTTAEIADSTPQDIDITLIAENAPTGTAIFTITPHRSIVSRVDYYVLAGTSSSYPAFSEEIAPSGTYQKELLEGGWSFTIKAYDEDDNLLGESAAKSAAISEDTPTSIALTVSVPTSTVTLDITTDETIPADHTFSLYGTSEYDSINEDDIGESIELTYGNWDLVLNTNDSTGAAIKSDEISCLVDGDEETIELTVTKTGTLVMNITADPLIKAQNPVYKVAGTREGGSLTLSKTLQGSAVVNEEIGTGTWDLTVYAESSEGTRISETTPINDVVITLDEETGVDCLLEELRFTLTIDASVESTAVEALITNYLVTGSNGIEAFSLESATLPIDRDLTGGDWEISCIGEDDSQETIASGFDESVTLGADASVEIALQTVVDKGTLMLQLQPDQIVTSRADHYDITYTDSTDPSNVLNQQTSSLIISRDLTYGDWDITVEAVDGDGHVISETEEASVTVELKKTVLQLIPVDIIRYDLALIIDASDVTSAVDHYTVDASSPYEIFSIDPASSPVERTVSAGQWDVSVQAWDAAGLLIGDASDSYDVNGNMSPTITLTNVAHTGSLFISFDTDDYLASQSKSYAVELTDGVDTVNRTTTYTSIKVNDLAIGDWDLTVTAKDATSAVLATDTISDITILEDQTVTETAELVTNRADLALTVVDPGTVTGISTYTYVGYSDSDAFVYEDETVSTLTQTSILSPGDWNFIVIAYDNYGVPIGVYQDEATTYACDGISAVTESVTLEAKERSRTAGARAIPETEGTGIMVIKTSVWEEIAADADLWSLSVYDETGTTLYETFTSLTESTFVKTDMPAGTYDLVITTYDDSPVEIASAGIDDLLIIADDVTYAEVTTYPPVSSLTVSPVIDTEISSIVDSCLYILTQDDREQLYIRGSESLDLTVDTILTGLWDLEVTAYDAAGNSIAGASGVELLIANGVPETSEPVLDTVEASLLVQINLDESFTTTVASYDVTATCSDLAWTERHYTTGSSLFRLTDPLPVGNWDISVYAINADGVTVSDTAEASVTVIGSGQKMRTVTLQPLSSQFTANLAGTELGEASYTIMGSSADDSFVVNSFTGTTWQRSLSPGVWTLRFLGYDSTGTQVSSAQWSGEVYSAVETDVTMLPLTGVVYISVSPAAGFSNTIDSWVVTGDAASTDAYDFLENMTQSGILVKELPGGDWEFTAQAFASGLPVSLDASSGTVSVLNNRNSVVELVAQPIESSLSLGSITDAAQTTPASYTIIGQSDSSVFNWTGSSLDAFSESLPLGDWSISIAGYDAAGLKISTVVVTVTSDGAALEPAADMERIVYEGTLCVEITPTEYIQSVVDHYRITLDGTDSYDITGTFWSRKVEIGTYGVEVSAISGIGEVLSTAAASPDPEVTTNRTTLCEVALEEESSELTVSLVTEAQIASQIDHYHVTVLGPDQVVNEDITLDAYTLEDITPGTWVVKAQAYNSAGKVIASGEDQVEIGIGEIALCTVDLITATGDIYVSILADDVVTQQVDHYTLELSNGSDLITESSITTSNWSKSDIDVGLWDLSVSAYSESGTLIGIGTKDSIPIDPNKMNIVEITVSQTDDAVGDFILNVTYPTDVDITATLVGSDAIQHELTITGNPGSATLTDLLPGYYVLTIRISEDGIVSGTETQTVQILGGQTTTVDATIEKEEGAITVFITNPLDEEITVIISGLDDGEEVSYADAATIELYAAMSVTPDAVDWYLNGQMLSDHDNDHELTLTGLTYGNYQISCIVTDDGAIGSDAVDFSIVE